MCDNLYIHTPKKHFHILSYHIVTDGVMFLMILPIILDKWHIYNRSPWLLINKVLVPTEQEELFKFSTISKLKKKKHLNLLYWQIIRWKQSYIIKSGIDLILWYASFRQSYFLKIKFQNISSKIVSDLGITRPKALAQIIFLVGIFLVASVVK